MRVDSNTAKRRMFLAAFFMVSMIFLLGPQWLKQFFIDRLAFLFRPLGVMNRSYLPYGSFCLVFRRYKRSLSTVPSFCFGLRVL